MIRIDSLERQQAYLRGILAAAKHHGRRTEHVLNALIGAVLTRKTDDLFVREAPSREDRIGLALWFRTHRGWYSVSYDHAHGGGSPAIVIKQGTQQGPVLHRFDNDTPLADISAAFATL